MRKMYKRKRRTCALCKGHKRGKWVRWTDRDRSLLHEFERGRQDVEGSDGRGSDG